MAKKPTKIPSAEAFDTGGVAAATPSELRVLNETLHELVSQQELVDQLEEDLKAAKRNLHFLSTTRVPELMSSLNMSELVFNDWKVKIESIVSGSLPKEPDKREAAIRWLNEHEGGGLIKTEINLTFSKTQHNEALAVAEDLRAAGHEPDVTSGVHAQTLCAFARERLASGEPIDLDVLGLYTGRVAKVKEQKPKKGKGSK